MEVLRDQRGLRWLEDLWRDLAYACRLLAANPVFAATGQRLRKWARRHPALT